MKTLTALALLACTLMLGAPLSAQQVSSTVRGKPGPLQITWLGHAAFELVSPGGTRILIDPFLKNNPSTPTAFKDLSRYRPAAVLVTHAHPDHTGDAVDIVRASGAQLIGTSEWVAGLDIPDAQKKGGNVGGTFTVGDVTIHLVPAVHSSEPGGRPLGFVITLADGRSIYHTGDTWLFEDMKLIQKLYRPEILLLCVGGGAFTQDPATAATAVKDYFSPKTIIPMHYATMPGLASEADVRSAFAKEKRLRVMHPGETATF